MDETIEQPQETCGLMIVMEGGVTTTVNLFTTKEEVISKIQNYISDELNGLIEFKTANPDEQETFLFDPKKVMIAMIKKEFIIQSGKIVPVSGLIEKGNTGKRRF